MNFRDIYASNYTVQNWIEQSLLGSNEDWYISVFKLSGTYRDGFGLNRQVFNDLTQGRVLRSLDATINITRGKIKSDFKFIPFIGGNRNSDIRVARHIHAFIEIPKNCNKDKFEKFLIKNWSIYPRRYLKMNLESNLWLQTLDKNRIKTHLKYCTRQEDLEFYEELYGDSKVLLECNSCRF